jgi:hypothetical protein
MITAAETRRITENALMVRIHEDRRALWLCIGEKIREAAAEGAHSVEIPWGHRFDDVVAELNSVEMGFSAECTLDPDSLGHTYSIRWRK